MTEAMTLRYGPGVVGWRVKVQGSAALWGSLLKSDDRPPDNMALPLEAPHVVLLVRVDPRGAPVALYRFFAPSENNTNGSLVATLEPSNTFGIRIDGTYCVEAVVCDKTGNAIGRENDSVSSYVDCVLMPSYW